ncbi:MAG: penicillin-binding protein [Candidatus Omnitrophica bacterium]|nr:penicillin-binding protein [Candidatus Omnitrophota bacterium]
MLTATQKNRVALTITALLVIALGVAARLFWLQILHPQHWVTLARRQHWTVLELPATRGQILDRHERTLATSIRLTSVFADPRHVKNPLLTARKLSPLLSVPVDRLMTKLSQKNRGFVWLARRIPNQAAAQIRSLKLQGVEVMKESQRVYPQGYLASHLLGFAGLDSKGLEGLELAFDKVLQGQAGWRWLSRDARRRPLMTWGAAEVAPRDGLELVLTLDTTLQFVAEQALEKAFRKSRAQGGSIVVMNPATGEILALANRPTFDPNQFGQGHPEIRRNRAITDTFEPGSVFKIVTAAVALGKGLVTPGDSFYCEQGAFRVSGGHVLHDYHPYGRLTFREVITHSSNIGTVKVAMKIGPQALYDGIRAFGFGVPTGIELPGEVGGTARPPSQWSKLSITAIPMGQEVTVTALQLAQGMSVLANGGYLVKPWLVKEIRHPDGTAVKRFQPTPVRKVLEEKVAHTLKEILAGVVEEGTGKMAQVAGIRTAGKTGTAQKVDPNGTYSQSRYVASFVGFAPVEDPKLVIAVILDEPQPIHFGGVVSAPVFREVVGQSLGYLEEENLQLASRP